MRYRFVIGVVGLVALWGLLEQRAAVCGFGLTATKLPYGLLGQSYNGQFWVGDAQGWGVVWPPEALHLVDGRTIDVDRIEAYTAARGLRLLVRTAEGPMTVVEVVKDGTSFGLKLDEQFRSIGDRTDQEALEWTYVQYDRCIGGHADHLRLTLLAGMILLAIRWILAQAKSWRVRRGSSD
jgi:hypothetical protein